jgi:signal transduction histidine kinase
MATKFGTAILNGAGLGLAVSYQIIQDHKGSIEIKSQVGRGTTFIINLPATEE